MAKILIVEDETKMADELSLFLQNNHYEVEKITDFHQVEKQMLQFQGDLILLDLNLPEVSGQDLCKNYHQKKATPIVIITSQNNEMNELLCLHYGADDFVVKPYNPLILLARIQKILDRTMHLNTIRYLDLIVDLSKSMMIKGQQVIELSKNELKILHFLLMHQGQIQSREAIINYLWDSDMFVDDNTLTVNINRLRHKLDELGYKEMIKTKRGQGYLIS
ncbi:MULTISPECIES: response regulator transcription factor [Coprobacillaceae]|uniref:response regulator transcription factor n=1 Tax=Coprobacillaceae TaxID=2810280 RepID=UPI000E52BA94|nr:MULTISPECIES: response regulator transcription factor [Coprobacillaceae]RHM62903.1 DNA-binding response regulator [Coprobacillus sp. AF33-1AC]RHS94956.1 DNA-binding response regulator [Erysipelatoclostridium sp. AM42-17]